MMRIPSCGISRSHSVGLNAEILSKVDSIIQAIMSGGDEAPLDFTARFDGVQLTPETIRVDSALIDELALCCRRRDDRCNARRSQHSRFVTTSTSANRRLGDERGQWRTPGSEGPATGHSRALRAGRAAYPSTVMMNAICIGGQCQANSCGHTAGAVPAEPDYSRAVSKSWDFKEVHLIGALRLLPHSHTERILPRASMKIVGPGNQCTRRAAKKGLAMSISIDRRSERDRRRGR
ncbi:MAG: histidinol dehydrogenase [Acidobacteria bacterium]|nr:histidinol dehydrogenase [Acidobacteriota bacterium]